MPDRPVPAAAGADFREAMSRVAGAVHVVATSGPAGLGGATATAVTSISDAPPSLLVCLNQASSTLLKIRGNGAFSVNVLSGRQVDLAGVFAGEGNIEGEARFRASDGWIMGSSVPRLGGALACFSCLLVDLRPVGSHVVVIGTVQDVWTGGDEPPLVYHRRAYRTG